MLTTSTTSRKASRPATALRPTVTRNSIPPATCFDAIIGRASIINKLLDYLKPGNFQVWKVARASRPWNHAQDARATENRTSNVFKSLSFARALPPGLQLWPTRRQIRKVGSQMWRELRAKRAASPREVLNTFSMMVLKAAYGRANKRVL